jgi:hypothetical protein
VAYCLASMATLAFVGAGLVDGVEVGAQADFARAHLCDDRADRSMSAQVCGKCPFSGPNPESEKLSAMFGGFPASFPFISHCPTDGGFGGGH